MQTASQPLLKAGGRRMMLVGGYLDSTFTIAIGIALGGVGLIILGFAIWAIITKCGRKKSATVTPMWGDEKAQVGLAGQQGGMQQPNGLVPVVDAWAAAPMVQRPMGQPLPPWEGDDGELPPGIILSPTVPSSYNAIVSNPRPAGTPPFERLLLISSRVVRPDLVAAAALPNVAVVVYDWKNYTLQELMRHVKKVLGSSPVQSIGVVAPGSKPGSVGLLEGCTTSAEKLGQRTELSQFWRVLAGCVAASPHSSDGRRIDLIGCRVAESPAEGALLLRELYRLTTVPFTAADDALGGYVLSTFMEEPTTKAVMLISSTIPAIDMYFHRPTLLRQLPPAQPAAAAAAAAAYAAPLPGGLPPASALTSINPGQPLPAAAAASIVSSAPASPAVLAAAEGDIFSRFQASVKAYGMTPGVVFDRFDANKNGLLSQDEVLAMVQALVKDSSAADSQHVQAMLDVDGHIDSITRQEFIDVISSNMTITSNVRAGNDDGDVMQRLRDYLRDHATLLRQVFVEHDPQGTGSLGHLEIQQLVSCIPGLNANEQKYIVAFLYHNADSHDGRLTFDELSAVITPTQTWTPLQAATVNIPQSQSQPATRPTPPSTPTVSTPAGPLAPTAVYPQPQIAILSPAALPASSSGNPNSLPAVLSPAFSPAPAAILPTLTNLPSSSVTNPTSLPSPFSPAPTPAPAADPITSSSSYNSAPAPAPAKLQPLVQPNGPSFANGINGMNPQPTADPFKTKSPFAPSSGVTPSQPTSSLNPQWPQTGSNTSAPNTGADPQAQTFPPQLQPQQYPTTLPKTNLSPFAPSAQSAPADSSSYDSSASSRPPANPTPPSLPPTSRAPPVDPNTIILPNPGPVNPSSQPTNGQTDPRNLPQTNPNTSFPAQQPTQGANQGLQPMQPPVNDNIAAKPTGPTGNQPGMFQKPGGFLGALSPLTSWATPAAGGPAPLVRPATLQALAR